VLNGFLHGSNDLKARTRTKDGTEENEGEAEKNEGQLQDCKCRQRKEMIEEQRLRSVEEQN
jgi:hypothetical protein